MEKSAVEFLEKELNELLVLFDDKWEQVNTAINQAKEMEEQNKQRIVLEWTKLNGKKFPKRVIDIVPEDKLPKKPYN